LETTGHAARGVSSPPSPSVTNLWLEPGAVTPGEMISDIAEGFYVTELFGMELLWQKPRLAGRLTHPG